MSNLDHRRQVAAADRRRTARFVVEVPAFIETVVGRRSCRISNISDMGAMLEAETPPPAGIAARLSLGDYDIFCTVKWSQGKACGVEFDRPISENMLAGVASETQHTPGPVANVARIQMGAKRRGKLVSGD